MEPHDIFQMVLLANVLTACFIYGMWRIVKNEWDIRGMLWVLVPCAIAALLSWPFQ